MMISQVIQRSVSGQTKAKSIFAFATIVLAGTCCFVIFSTFKWNPYVWTQSIFTNQSPFRSATTVTWKRMFQSLYVGSPYYISYDKKPQIHFTMIARITDKEFWASTQCTCIFSFHNDSCPRITQNGTLGIQPEHHSDERRNFTAGRIWCLTPPDYKDAVKIELRCVLKKNKFEKYGALNFSAPVFLPDRNFTKSPTFVHCLAPLWGNYDHPYDVIQFIEYYRYLGVTHFIWYLASASDRVKKVLWFYENRGIMEIVLWNLPVWKKEIHYYGQIAALDDCFLRTTGRWDFTLNVDVDEFIATTNQSGLAEIVKNDTLDYDCVYFRSSGVKVGDRRDRKAEKTCNPVSFLRTKQERDPITLPYGVRTKYLCKGQVARRPGIHMLYETTANMTQLVPEPDETILLHYRDGDLIMESNRSLVIEQRAFNLSLQSEGLVKIVWQKLFCHNYFL